MNSNRICGLAVATLVALVAGAGPASGQNGFNLSWTDCGTAGLLQKNFACSSNAGSQSMVASAISGSDLTQLVGMQSAIILQTDQASLSDWWQLGPGGCRSADPPILSASFDFTTQVNCLDAWGGVASGGLVYEAGYSGSNRARIRVSCGVPGSVSINGIDEYYLFKLTLTNERSTGAGSCAGCGDGACIMLYDVLLTQPAGVGDVHIISPIIRNYVQWQQGMSLGQCPFTLTPPVSSPTSTWGAVKSLYR